MNTPPNPNQYSIDGTMRNYSASGLERYRKALIQYLQSKGDAKSLAQIAIIAKLSIQEYAIYRGAMLIKRKRAHR